MATTSENATIGLVNANHQTIRRGVSFTLWLRRDYRWSKRTCHSSRPECGGRSRACSQALPVRQSATRASGGRSFHTRQRSVSDAFLWQCDGNGEREVVEWAAVYPLADVKRSTTRC